VHEASPDAAAAKFETRANSLFMQQFVTGTIHHLSTRHRGYGRRIRSKSMVSHARSIPWDLLYIDRRSGADPFNGPDQVRPS
jgi:hypothetical protein